MARRRAIEADELFETANRLQADGKDVTAIALLDALGGGSLRTIYKHLEVWQQRRPSPVITVSEEIPAGVQSAFASAWRLSQQEAGRAVLTVKEKAAEEVEAALKQFQDALTAMDKLEKESEADAQQIESLKQKLTDLEAALQKSQTDGAAYRATREQLQQQVKSQEAEIERLHGELDKERVSRQQEIERIMATAESQSKVDHAERDAAITEAAELRGLSEALKAQNADLLSRIGRDDRHAKQTKS